MPELMETGRERNLAPGDVLMVARKIMKPKFGAKPYWWRFFFVVTKHKKWLVYGLVVGTENENLKGKEITFEFDDDANKNIIQFLPMEEWPDGVHAFRMAMVLQGLIQDVV
jgi:hypothetical protein